MTAYLPERAYTMTPDELMNEATRLHAISELGEPFPSWLYERGCWFHLLVRAAHIDGEGDGNDGMQ